MRRRGNPVVPELSEKEDSRMGSVLDRVVPQIANRARRIQKDLADGKILLSPNEDDDENDDEDDDEDLDTEGDWGADVRINGQGQLEVYGPPPAVGGQRRAARKTASVWQIVPSLELDREETTPSRVRSGRREEESLEDTIIVHHDSPRSSSTASVLGSQRFLGHAKDKMLLEALDAAASTEPARQQQAGGAAVQQDSVGGAVRRTQQAWREQQRPIQAARQLQMETTHARARRRSNTNRQSSGENSIPESIEAEPEESESSRRAPKRPAQRTRRQSSPRIKSSAQISREYQETLRKREKQKNVYEPFPAAKPPPKLFATPQELRQKRLKEISEEDARKTAKGAGITRNAHDRHSRYINKTSGLIAKKSVPAKSIDERLKMGETPQPRRSSSVTRSLERSSRRLSRNRDPDDELIRGLFSLSPSPTAASAGRPPSEPTLSPLPPPPQPPERPPSPPNYRHDEYLSMYTKMAEEDPYAQFY